MSSPTDPRPGKEKLRKEYREKLKGLRGKDRHMATRELREKLRELDES